MTEKVALIMEPATEPMNWRDFLSISPPYAIAIDGYVNKGPRFQESGPRANFNHHEEVDRLATRCTCAQILLAIRQGFFSCFRNNEGPIANVYANDCDEDVCTSWFLLKYGYLAEHVTNPALNRLVHAEDMLDSTAGAYPFSPVQQIIRELAWVYEPYRRARLCGDLDSRDPQTFFNIVTDVELRIMAHITGRGGEISLNTKYRKIGGGDGWSMIVEDGPHAKTGAFADGIRAYVSVRDRLDGRFTYTIGRMSSFIPFNVSKILLALNEAESCEGDRWGGGNTIGGSPRVSGSGLKPADVERIINEQILSLGMV